GAALIDGALARVGAAVDRSTSQGSVALDGRSSPWRIGAHYEVDVPDAGRIQLDLETVRSSQVASQVGRHTAEQSALDDAWRALGIDPATVQHREPPQPRR